MGCYLGKSILGTGSNWCKSPKAGGGLGQFLEQSAANVVGAEGGEDHIGP